MHKVQEQTKESSASVKTKTSKKSLFSKRTALIGTIVALLLVGAYIGTAAATNIWPFSTIQSTDNFSEGYTDKAPTQQEIDASQDAKKRNDDQKQPTSPQNDQAGSQAKQQVSVAISFADLIDSKLEIRAFTSGIIEGSGKCIVTVSQSSQKITRESEAFIDVSSSICRPVYINQSELSAGEWDIEVRYLSDAAEGKSEITKVTI